MFNNLLQKRNFAAILEKADHEYASRPIHIALSTDQLLSRVWIINEFAKRKQAGKKTTLVTAGGSEGKRIQQLQRKWTYLCCWRHNNIEHDYFENLQATVEEDKIQIRENLLKLYGTKDDFNREIKSLVESLNFDYMAYSFAINGTPFIISAVVIITVLYWIRAGELGGVGDGSASTSTTMNSTFHNDSYRNVSIQSSNASQVNQTSTPETNNILGEMYWETSEFKDTLLLLKILSVLNMNLLKL